jgi:hypothetical protein
MRHEYLRPGDEKPPRGGWVSRLLLVWLLLVGTFLAAWIGSAGGASWAIPLVFFVFAVVLFLRVRTTLRPGAVRDLQAAQLERLRERVPEAIARCRTLLGRGLSPYYRALVLLALGECAEMEGDFAEAARILVLAEGMLRVSRVNKVLRAQQLALVAARRAFAHAACGELDRAEATLRTAGVRDGVPLAGPLSSRAMLLVLARRGLKQQVLERLAMDGKLLRNAMAFRDRSLVAVIGAYASGREVPQGSIDAAIVPWIASAFPEARAVIGGVA